MSDINQCVFTGRLGRDVESRFLTNGSPVCNFSIAVSSFSKGKEYTTWVKCCAFDAIAESCGKLLSKGSQVGVVGRLQTRDYENKDGDKKEVTELVLTAFPSLLGGNGPNRAAGERSGARQGEGSGARPKPTPQERYDRREEQAKHENRGVHPNEMDQSIPF